MHYLPFGEKIIKETGNADNHHLIKNTLIGIEKLNSGESYSPLVYSHPFIPPSQKYFKELLTL